MSGRPGFWVTAQGVPKVAVEYRLLSTLVTLTAVAQRLSSSYPLAIGWRMEKYTVKASAMPQNSTLPGVKKTFQSGFWPLRGHRAQSPPATQRAYTAQAAG